METVALSSNIEEAQADAALTRHDWVIDPDTNQIIKKPDEKVAARRCYQTAHNAVNALTKSVLQEELWVNRHVKQLAESPCEVHFETKGTQVTVDAKFTDPAMVFICLYLHLE